MTFALSIRENYDELADEYGRQLFNELEHKPLDRELLDRFVASVPENGEVCDMGCGPGQVTRYLHLAGALVSGLDLSPRMVEIAKQLNPDVRFRVGSMMDLDFADGHLAGISAFYAIVNIPDDSLPLVFREMARVLQPGGPILLAFHIGDDTIHVDKLWGEVHLVKLLFLFGPCRSNGRWKPLA